MSAQADWDDQHRGSASVRPQRIPSRVTLDLRDALDSGMITEERFNHILGQSPREVFKWWLEWNGIIGWDSTIWNVVSGLKGEPCD